jgi:hypothetical protein
LLYDIQFRCMLRNQVSRTENFIQTSDPSTILKLFSNDLPVRKQLVQMLEYQRHLALWLIATIPQYARHFNTMLVTRLDSVNMPFESDNVTREVILTLGTHQQQTEAHLHLSNIEKRALTYASDERQQEVQFLRDQLHRLTKERNVVIEDMRTHYPDASVRYPKKRQPRTTPVLIPPSVTHSKRTELQQTKQVLDTSIHDVQQKLHLYTNDIEIHAWSETVANIESEILQNAGLTREDMDGPNGVKNREIWICLEPWDPQAIIETMTSDPGTRFVGRPCTVNVITQPVPTANLRFADDGLILGYSVSMQAVVLMYSETSGVQPPTYLRAWLPPRQATKHDTFALALYTVFDVLVPPSSVQKTHVSDV